MVLLENVYFKYANCQEYALKNINLHIKQGDFVVLLGASGCGKTTITRLINRLAPEFFAGELNGTITVNGMNTTKLDIQDLTGIVGSVFQDPRSQFFATDTTAEIAFSCENVGLPSDELCLRIEKSANDLKISKLLERSVFELSSGEKQSIAIASVYALSPKILILDEPSANLDTVATQHLMEILNTLKKKKYTIIISEHRIHYLKDIADRAIVIENGMIVKEMDSKKFSSLTNEKANNMGLRSLDLTKIIPSFALSQYDKRNLSLEHISFKYNKQSVPLKDVTFNAEKGSIVGIIGNNGVGKSTLLETVCGLKKETSGKISLDGIGLKPKKRIESTYLVMQDSSYQLFTESVGKELYLGRIADEEIKEKGRFFLEQMGLSNCINRHPASLSGGQKQRLCVAVACMKGSDVVCFDEPTSGLDYNSMKKMSELLHMLSEENKTLLVASHDYEFLMTTCTHICYLKDGAVQDYFAVSEQTAHKIYQFLFQKED